MANGRNKKETVCLDRRSSIPFFVQIAETLKRRILSGEYNQGMLTFTGEELEQEFEASNITIRKALDMLRRDGIVERRRGLGTTISEVTSEPVVFELSGSFQKVVEAIGKMQCRMKVVEIATVPCPKRVQKILCLKNGKDVWRMKRVRTNKGVPVSFYTYYANPSYCQAVSKTDAKEARFFDTFQRVTEMKIDNIRQTIRATVADLDISAALEIPFGAPVFYNENIYISASDEVLFLCQSYYRGDLFAFKASVQV